MTGRRPRYFDRDGNEITRQRCDKLLRDHDYRTIRITQLRDSRGTTWHVTTQWIGVDRSEGEPLIFEIVVMRGIEDPDRYLAETVAAARKRHAQIIENLLSADPSSTIKEIWRDDR